MKRCALVASAADDSRSSLTDLDLSDRKEWRGIVLWEDEAADALQYMSDGISEAAGRVGGWVAEAARRARKRREEGGGEGSSEGSASS